MFFGVNVSKLKDARDFAGLAKALDHKKIEIRKEAAGALKDLATTADAFPVLCKALLDPDPGVRVYAVQGLGRIKNTQSEEKLHSATTDPNWEVRKEALSALAKSASNITPLLAAIRFDSAELREIAANRLGDFPGAETVQALIVALQDEEELVRLRAAKSLGKIKDPSSLEALQNAMNDEDPQVIKAVQQALDAMK